MEQTRERFTLYNGDPDIFEDLDTVNDMFVQFTQRPPSLADALMEAGVQNTSLAFQHAMEFGRYALKEPSISQLGLTEDEAGALAAYTLQWAGGVKSPCEAVNEALCSARDRDRRSITSGSKLIYLFLSGLRKLPKARPESGKCLYRGVCTRVPLSKEEACSSIASANCCCYNCERRQAYIPGHFVTWWGFTTTSPDPDVPRKFVCTPPAAAGLATEMPRECTLFSIYGTDLWGYDIQAFSPFEECGILLEPEAKVMVTKVTEASLYSPSNTPAAAPAVVEINVELRPFVRLVLEDVIPVSAKATALDPLASILYKPKEEEILPQLALPSNTVWKECPKDAPKSWQYSVDKKQPRVAVDTKGSREIKGCAIIVGSSVIPMKGVTSWSVNVLKTKNNDGRLILIGVAPADIDQCYNGYDIQGWYFNCWNMSPYTIEIIGKTYPKGKPGENVHNGTVVGVVLNGVKGELSFILDGKHQGVAYKDIPVDKPLVPCVLLGCKGDSVELDINKALASPSEFVSKPANVRVVSSMWDPVVFTWDHSAHSSEGGYGTTYKAEINEKKVLEPLKSRVFVQRGLWPGEECRLRVRTVIEGRVGDPCEEFVYKVPEAPPFAGCSWRDCLPFSDPNMGGRDSYFGSYNLAVSKRYALDKDNRRVATKTGEDGVCCTVAGNTLLPIRTTVGWNVKVLQSKSGDGRGIFIGVAPSSINQKDDNYYSCGWYISCCDLRLYSGPPHCYCSKAYASAEKDGRGVGTGEAVGVVVDTAMGDISFTLDDVNLGVAYKGISLDKPLVPCALLRLQGDSVELII